MTQPSAAPPPTPVGPRLRKSSPVVEFIKNYWISVVSFAAFLALWQTACVLGWIGEYQLVPPTEVFTTFVTKLTDPQPDGAVLMVHLWASLKLALSGFAAAALVGVPLGLLMGWYQPVNLLVRPLFDALRPIPPIAWIPIAMLWLGIGFTAKVYIIWLSAFVPCVINAYTGIRLTNPVLIRVAQIYGASDWETFMKIGVPSAAPMVFTGLKLSLNAAWTTLVAAELLAAAQGLGYMIQMGRRVARPEIILVGMVTIGLSGALMAWLLTKLEAYFFSSSRRLT